MEKRRNNSCVVVTMHDLFKLINVDTTKKVKAFATLGFHIVTNSLAFSKNRLFLLFFFGGVTTTLILLELDFMIFIIKPFYGISLHQLQIKTVFMFYNQ